MKKVISLILCVVMMGLCVFPAVAAPTTDSIITDLMLGSLGYIVTQEGEKLLLSEAVSRKGDVNFDGKVTAVDARLCLQAVASPLNSLNIGLADVNNDGKISAVDARIMLQDVAGTNEVVTYVQAKKGGSIVIGPLYSSSNTTCYWQCDVDKSELKFFDRIFDKSTTEVVDAVITQYLVFTPGSEGTYTLNIKLANAKGTEVVDDFKCVVTVIDN
jgi:hypothetical protein